MKRFALGILAGCFGLLGSLAAAYMGLALLWPASFPAPPITRLAALDEKLRFLRHHPELAPRILAVGSSITFRQLAGDSFARLAGGSTHFLNGATNGLQIHQTRDLLEFYLTEFPRVRTVLIMAGLPDFEDCTVAPQTLFDHADAKAYAFDDWPAAYFYFRYFSPQRFARTALTLEQRQTPFTGDLYHDVYGSGPLQVPEEAKRGLRYLAIDDHDPACVSELIELSAALTERGIRLVLVFPPLHPEYRQAYPATVPATCKIARQIELATRQHNTDLLVLHQDADFEDADFYDAFHLQYAAVKRLSVQVARRIEQSAAANTNAQAIANDGLPRGPLRRSCALNEARS